MLPCSINIAGKIFFAQKTQTFCFFLFTYHFHFQECTIHTCLMVCWMVPGIEHGLANSWCLGLSYIKYMYSNLRSYTKLRKIIRIMSKSKITLYWYSAIWNMPESKTIIIYFCRFKINPVCFFKKIGTISCFSRFMTQKNDIVNIWDRRGLTNGVHLDTLRR